MLERINELDVELLIYLNGLGSTTWDGFWMFMTTTVYSVPFYLVALYFVYKTYGTRKTLYSLLFLAILITASDQLSNAFKYGFERLRPCHNEEVKDLIRLVKSSCGGYYSFFSAHASTSMAIVVYFALLIKSKVKYFALFLIFWAVLIGYSRVYIGVHYPFDVLFGFTVGGTIGFTIFILFKTFLQKFIDK